MGTGGVTTETAATARLQRPNFLAATTKKVAMLVPPAIESAALPPMLTVPQAAQVLGIGRTLAYELVRTNAWPTPVLRAGRLIKIPTAPLLQLLATGRLPGANVA